MAAAPGLHLHRHHLVGPPRHLEREAAGVGEAVERTAAGVLAGAQVVLPLVEEGAGLLPGEQVEPEAHRPLADLHRARVLPQRPTPFTWASPSSSRTRTSFRSSTARSPSSAAEQRGQQLLAPLGPGHQRLDHPHVAVAVGHQPGQQVGLSVNHAPEGLLAEGAPPQPRRRGDAPGEEALVDRLLVAGEQADGDLRALRPEGLALEAAPPVHQRHHVAAGGPGGVATSER